MHFLKKNIHYVLIFHTKLIDKFIIDPIKLFIHKLLE